MLNKCLKILGIHLCWIVFAHKLHMSAAGVSVLGNNIVYNTRATPVHLLQMTNYNWHVQVSNEISCSLVVADLIG